MKFALFTTLLLSSLYASAEINEEKTQNTLVYEYENTHSKHIFYSLSRDGQHCLLTNFQYSEEKGTNSTIAAVEFSYCEGLVVAK